jgi:hypothetical protein
MATMQCSNPKEVSMKKNVKSANARSRAIEHVFRGKGLRVVLRATGQIDVFRGRTLVASYRNGQEAWEAYVGEPDDECPIWQALQTGGFDE